MLLRPGVVVVLLLPSEDGFAVGEKEVVLLGGGLLLLLLRGCGFSFAVKAGECLLLCVGTSSSWNGMCVFDVGAGLLELPQNKSQLPRKKHYRSQRVWASGNCHNRTCAWLSLRWSCLKHFGRRL